MTREFIDLSAMSKQEARVLIAKDVLKHLEAEKMKVKTGVYLTIPLMEVPEAPLHEILEANTCNVCALGSLIYAKTLLANRVGSDVLKTTIWDCIEYKWDQLRVLEEFFSKESLGWIEYYFEGEDCGQYTELVSPDEEELNSIDYFYCNNSSRERLKLIMQNIITNGDFKPELL